MTTDLPTISSHPRADDKFHVMPAGHNTLNSAYPSKVPDIASGNSGKSQRGVIFKVSETRTPKQTCDFPDAQRSGILERCLLKMVGQRNSG